MCSGGARPFSLQVEIAINQLPQLPRGAHYECVFGHSTPVQARATQHGLACSTPAVPDRPPIPAGSGESAVAAEVARCKRARGLRFVRRPTNDFEVVRAHFTRLMVGYRRRCELW